MIVRKPPMGWNSWNTFGANIDEKLIKETADAMVESGLLEAGYEYLVIDDCWAELKRGEDGRLVPSHTKFPNGMKAVADYVHSKGLKFGMYSCAGNLTCAGYPASFEHEFEDAATFAEWGVDYLKYDYCFKPSNQPGHLLYKRMGLALANCGRDILFSACSWGADNTNEWIKETGAHMWRSTGDICESFRRVKEITFEQLDLLKTNGHGCFNDMDMLIVGMNGEGNVGAAGCTPEEYITHFAVWCFFGSPLMIGCDVRKMDEVTKEILFNKELIAIDQDEANRQPFKCASYWNEENVLILARYLDGGDIAVGVFNFAEFEISPCISFDGVGIYRGDRKALSVRDVIKHEELGIHKDFFRTDTIGIHGCRVYRCKVVDAE